MSAIRNSLVHQYCRNSRLIGEQVLARVPCRQYASDRNSPPEASDNVQQPPTTSSEEAEQGAMSRRLQEMIDENIEQGGRSARNAVHEAGFSDDLKRRLEEKIANAGFRSDNASAFAQVNLPASAGKGTRDIASAQPWTGTESVGDASLRMLNDAHKPLRVPSKMPGVRGPPAKVDTGRKSVKTGTGTRLANARDQSSYYSLVKESGLSEEEREKFRKEMKQRFEPAARSLPATLQGLTALANQRIEDAIARGQFKNLPRGKKIERDHNANNPFINTTEYFMNKMIQRQEIVPPWIEKQQELVQSANKFRSRLRADWKRHVARNISSRGGSVESQMQLAEEYAYAEHLANPSKKSVEKLHAVDKEGHLSQITITGQLKPEPSDDATAMEEELKVMEQTFNDDGSLKPPSQQIEINAEHTLTPPTPSPPSAPRPPTLPPFRDPQWESTERSYHTLAVENLNSLTRSYNLMAPNLAKKPYFSLDRELRACFADVAPLIAGAIRERAYAPKVPGSEMLGRKPGAGGVLERFSIDAASHVYDEQKPQYGLKELWRDWWGAAKK